MTRSSQIRPQLVLDLTLSSHSVTHSESRSRSAKLSTGFGGSQADLPRWSLRAAFARLVGRVLSWQSTIIAGFESLGIELGKHQVFLLELTITAEVGSGATKWAKDVPALLQYALPERDTFARYAHGDLSDPATGLPLGLVADAVERMLKKDLLLDLRTTRLLLERYWDQRSSATATLAGLPPHDEQQLADYLAGQVRKEIEMRQQAGLPPGSSLPAGQVGMVEVQRVARDLTADELPVDIPAPFLDGQHESVVVRYDLNDRAGNRALLFATLERLVEQLEPGLLERSDKVWNFLIDQVGGQRWLGHLNRMLTAKGLILMVPVPNAAGEVDPDERMFVRIKARFGADPRMVGRTDTVGIGGQLYGYVERVLTFVRNRFRGIEAGGSRSVDVAPGDLTQAAAPGAGAGAGRDRSSSGTQSTQATRVQGYSTWKGADEVRQSLHIEISVTRTGPDGVRGTPAEGELDGSIIRLIPDGLVRARTTTTVGRQQRLDDRIPMSMPRPGVADVRPDPLVAHLAGHPKLGPTTLMQEWILGQMLAPSVLNAFLPVIASPQGMSVGAVPVEGSPDREIDVRLHAELFAESVLIDGRTEVELRDLDRLQALASVLASIGFQLPVVGGPDIGTGDSGLGGNASFGQRGARGSSTSHGDRSEASLYARGMASTLRTRRPDHRDAAGAEGPPRCRGARRGGGRAAAGRRRRVPAGLRLRPGPAAQAGPRAGGFRGQLRADRLRGHPGPAFPGPIWGPGPSARLRGATYGGATGGAGVGGPFAIGGYSQALTDLVLVALQRVGADQLAAWTAGGAQPRAPPRLGLQPHERLLVVDPARLIDELVRMGLDPYLAADAVRRLHAFSWRHTNKLHVIAVTADKLAEMELTGTWERVLAHERDDHLSGQPIDAAHQSGTGWSWSGSWRPRRGPRGRPRAGSPAAGPVGVLDGPAAGVAVAALP